MYYWIVLYIYRNNCTFDNDSICYNNKYLVRVPTIRIIGVRRRREMSSGPPVPPLHKQSPPLFRYIRFERNGLHRHYHHHHRLVYPISIVPLVMGLSVVALVLVRIFHHRGRRFRMPYRKIDTRLPNLLPKHCRIHNFIGYFRYCVHHPS